MGRVPAQPRSLEEGATGPGPSTSSTDAHAAIPSPRPVKPIRSVWCRLDRHPAGFHTQHVANPLRIRSRNGATRTVSAMTVRSTFRPSYRPGQPSPPPWPVTPYCRRPPKHRPRTESGLPGPREPPRRAWRPPPHVRPRHRRCRDESPYTVHLNPGHLERRRPPETMGVEPHTDAEAIRTHSGHRMRAGATWPRL